MAIRVSATEPNPTHDVSLSDGITTIGLHLVNGQGTRDPRAIRQTSTPRTSLQIQQGDPNYSGFNLPYTPIVQKDFSGGRGQLEINRDGTRYYDSYNVDTRYGKLILGPGRQATTGYNSPVTVGAAKDGTQALSNTLYMVASKYTPASSITIRSLTFRAYDADGDTNQVDVYIYSDSAGSPSTSLKQSETYATVSGTTPTDYTVNLPYTFTGGTTYWIVFIQNGSNLVVTSDTSEAGNSIQSNSFPPSSWVTEASDQALYFQLNVTGSGRVLFFEYRNTEMAITSPDDGAAPRLFMNGIHALATSNSTDKTRLNTSLSFASNTPNGGIAQVYAGPGAADEQNWRAVASYTNSGTNDYITVDDPWGTTHATATEFAVVNLDYWQEITGHGITARVTDVLVFGDYIYFALGDTTAIRRARWNQTGTMASGAQWTFTDEGNIDATYKGATFLRAIPKTDQTVQVWAAQVTTSKVYRADTVTTWTNLTFTASNSSKAIGNPRTKITGMIAYGDPLIPWIFKEDGFGSISNDLYAPVPNQVFTNVRSEYNGKASVVHDVYLFFSLLDGFDRYYDQHLDDMGMNRDEGLPATRRGHVVHALDYAGQVLACVDAGDTGYSAVFSWNGLGWHEVYRSATAGSRIRHMSIQVIPGDTVDRLWFSENEDIYWLPISVNPLKQSEYPYATIGHLITSWITTGFGEVIKFWKSLAVYASSLSASYYVTAQYQIDGEEDDDPWHDITAGNFDTSPVEEMLLSDNYNVTGKRIRFKLTLTAATNALSPIVRAYKVDAVTRVPPAKTWGLTFAADDMQVQEGDGELETLNMDGLLAQLEVWADSDQTAAPITMRSLIPQHDNKRVFLDLPNVQLREAQIDTDTRVIKSIGSLSLYEA